MSSGDRTSFDDTCQLWSRDQNTERRGPVQGRPAFRGNQHSAGTDRGLEMNGRTGAWESTQNMFSLPTAPDRTARQQQQPPATTPPPPPPPPLPPPPVIHAAYGGGGSLEE
eukprot:gene25549-biopygen9039